MKKAKQFSILDQVNLDQSDTSSTKTLGHDEVEQFTQKEIKEFIKYNEDIVKDVDKKYSNLTFRNRRVLVRLYVKDFGKNDGILNHSKTEYLKVASGIDDKVIYDEFPNPYPFSRKGIIISSEVSDLKVGDTVFLTDKPTVFVQKQDHGFPVVRGGFIHPEEEENYTKYPENPLDPNYGYILTDELNIELIYKK